MKAIDLIKPLRTTNSSMSFSDDLEIVKLTHDTRDVEPGSLFLCIIGTELDGHSFAQEAERKGAAMIIASKPVDVNIPVVYVNNTKKAMAILASVFYQYPSQQLRVIGVTGTNGKTTVTHLLDYIFHAQKEKTGVIGTMYRRIGAEVFETKNTTPDSITLQKTLHEMVEKGINNCSMEVSSHSLVQGRVWGTDFDIAIFTNLSQDHLEYHHTMENYAEAKSLLFSQLGNGYEKGKPKFAVLNFDDPVGRSFEEKTSAAVFSYGIDYDADFMASDLRITDKGTTFNLHFEGKTYEVTLQLVGKFNVSNALAAIAGAYAAGLELSDILQSISEISGVRGRFEMVKGDYDFAVIVDYAHTPDGLLNVLDAINEIKTNRVICVVGSGGDRDPSKRHNMGKIAHEHSDLAVFTSDNPRTEDPDAILEEVVQDLEPGSYTLLPDRREAIQFAINQAEPNDVILIAGKGHEDYQIVGTKKYHFDDVEEAKRAIDLKKGTK